MIDNVQYECSDRYRIVQMIYQRATKDYHQYVIVDRCYNGFGILFVLVIFRSSIITYYKKHDLDVIKTLHVFIARRIDIHLTFLIVI